MARTTSFDDATGSAGQHAHRAAQESRPWVERIARTGYAAKGTVYVLIGILAAQAAFGDGTATDSQGAFAVILEQPAGRLILGIVAVGLFCYALWRAVMAIVDPEGKGSDAKGIGARIAYGISALLHVSLGIEAMRLALGAASGGGGGGGGGGGAEHWTARALSLPLGQWLVGIAGAIVIAYGLYQAKRAFDSYVSKHLDLHELDANAARWVERTGRAGIAARAVVFALIGWFLIDAARSASAQEAGGLGEALRTLREQPYGAWLLGVVALGLVAYGLYQFINARYRRINV